MYPDYSYLNGSDCTWFGDCMIQQLIKNGFIDEAYEQDRPMAKRAKENNGFYGRYSIKNKPRRYGTLQGEAGVLDSAIILYEDWAVKQKYPDENFGNFFNC